VDGGDVSVRAGERIVAPFLESRGMDRLDAVIATHADSDHIGGLPEVFHELRVAWLVEGPTRSESQAYRSLVEAAEGHAARRDVVFAGDWIEAPAGARLLFLHPARGAVYSNHNNQSLVLMVDWRGCEILIAGDIERAGENDLLASGAELACQVAKVAHHGSALATSRAFLDRAQPTLAIISCGRNNPYGHPSPEVTDRLTSAGVAIIRTDRDGAVTVRFDGRLLEWRTEGKN
jgi:competence protein ComEC